jgi:hypothetical protein
MICCEAEHGKERKIKVWPSPCWAARADGKATGAEWSGIAAPPRDFKVTSICHRSQASRSADSSSAWNLTGLFIRVQLAVYF